MGRRKKHRNLRARWKRYSFKKKRRIILKLVAWVVSVVVECLITYAMTKLLGG